jgi:hypothetical protein
MFFISTNFPIICITLRENLRTLFGNTTPFSVSMSSTTYFALLAMLPPLAIALCTEDVGMLVGITGAYAGLGIQVLNLYKIALFRFESSGSFPPFLSIAYVNG